MMALKAMDDQSVIRGQLYRVLLSGSVVTAFSNTSGHWGLFHVRALRRVPRKRGSLLSYK
jgi:hypothetical protein